MRREVQTPSIAETKMSSIDADVQDADQKKRSTYNNLASRNVVIGDIHHSYGNFNLAIESYTQALLCSALCPGERCHKDIGLFLQKRANSLLRVGKHREAFEDAMEKIGLNPKDISGHMIAALCARYMDDVDSSTQFMQKASSYFAQLCLVVENTKLALQAKQHDHAQLLSLCDEFLEYSPFNDGFQLASSYFCALLKDAALGIQRTLTKYNNIHQLVPVAERCLQELQPRIGQDMFNDADLALRNGNYEKALELFSSLTEAVAVRDYYMGRSKTLLRMGRLEEALNDCNSASSLAGNQDWAVCKLRGQVFMEMKKFKEAAEQFESLLLQMDGMEHAILLFDAREALLKSTNSKKENNQPQLSFGSN